jgi:polysaccharide export outer membrane protein
MPFPERNPNHPIHTYKTMKTILMNDMTCGRQATRVSGRPARHIWRALASATACFSAVLVIFTSVGCQTNAPSEPIPAAASSARPSGALAPGDEINVTFSSAPELNTKQKIQPNGKVSMPTIGDVSAAGTTINSLQANLTSLYQPHLQDPTVVVSLESAAAGVYISGEVLRPGKIPLDRPMTALEAVMEAGGFTKFANPKQVIVVRNEKGRNQRYVLNMNDALSGAESTPFYVRPFDVIYVRQSKW